MKGKLGLGTVQFGLNYGISNQIGQTNLEEAKKILRVAARNQLKVLDTAALYGNSEEVLGQAIIPGDSFAIVTKTPRFDNKVITPQEVQGLEDSFKQSLQHLRQDAVYGLLIHNVNDLFLDNGSWLFKKMAELKELGLVSKIGVSVYTAEQIDRVLDNYAIDLIQLPINVFDQRLLTSGHLYRIKERGIEIHARSAFLQGLLLMAPDKLADYFNSIQAHLQSYHRFIRERELAPVQAALQFVMGISEIDTVICGVNDHLQLQEIYDYPTRQINPEEFKNYALTDEQILNPANWRK